MGVSDGTNEDLRDGILEGFDEGERVVGFGEGFTVGCNEDGEYVDG